MNTSNHSANETLVTRISTLIAGLVISAYGVVLIVNTVLTY